MDQQQIEIETHYYILQPGDGTCYRFSVAFIPDSMPQPERYVIQSGISEGAWLRVSIDMAGGAGVFVVPNAGYDLSDEGIKDTLYALRKVGGGADHVDRYTLLAVLLALRVLRHHPTQVENAALSMLMAQRLITEVYR
jgi:hypothetical protein